MMTQTQKSWINKVQLFLASAVTLPAFTLPVLDYLIAVAVGAFHLSIKRKTIITLSATPHNLLPKI